MSVAHFNPAPPPRLVLRVLTWLRHPLKSRGFPAKQERLVTAEDLMFLA